MKLLILRNERLTKRILFSFLFVMAMAIPIWASSAYAGTFCLCHNFDNPPGGNQICVGSLAEAVDGHQAHLDAGTDILGKCSPLGCGGGTLNCDSKLQTCEECDDGNNDNGDGCDENCQSEDDCPNDPNKTDPGLCGCGVLDTDSDGDGLPNCNDACPNDDNKTEVGICGCGVTDTDTDEDGTPDCDDQCPNDASKITPEICGCGKAETDRDDDGSPDCEDLCPDDPSKIEPGDCDCGVEDTNSCGAGLVATPFFFQGSNGGGCALSKVAQPDQSHGLMLTLIFLALPLAFWLKREFQNR